MEPRRREALPGKHLEVEEKRIALHGHRRKLHDRLIEVCEDFAIGDLGRDHKRSMLVRELEYLLGYYRDEENWQGIERPIEVRRTGINPEVETGRIDTTGIVPDGIRWFDLRVSRT